MTTTQYVYLFGRTRTDGAAGAIVLRVILITVAVALLNVPFLKLIGGALLLWIGVKLMQPEDDDGHGNIEGSTHHFESEHRVRHRDGSWRWMLVRGIAVRGAQGAVSDGEEHERDERKQADAGQDRGAPGIPVMPGGAVPIRQLDQAIRRMGTADFAQRIGEPQP